MSKSYHFSICDHNYNLFFFYIAIFIIIIFNNIIYSCCYCCCVSLQQVNCLFYFIMFSITPRSHLRIDEFFIFL